MNIKLIKKPVPIVSASGKIDKYNAFCLFEAVREACKNGSSIVLDLSGVAEINNATLESIVMAAQLTNANGGEVIIISDNRKMQIIIEIIARSSTNIVIAVDVDKALNSLKKVA